MAISVLKQTTSYRIEKGIAPAPKVGKYPFGDMEVGDSFHFDGERNRVTNAAHNHAIRHGVKFSVRKDGSGFRCFRIA